MGGADGLERLLRRDRAITLGALLVLCAAAWAYVVAGAGMGAPAWRMTSLALPPALSQGEPGHGRGMEMGALAMTGAPSPAPWPVRLPLVGLMWWSMMVAMMAPSATPMVLLYARIARKARGAGDPRVLGRTGWFVAGYLAVWLGFSAGAALLQEAFGRLAWVSPGLMAGQSRGFASTVLLLAGIYQLSPAHDHCLQRCRSPAAFLAGRYRPGAAGAWRLGLVHGAYCVGCCWLLMVLLFVGGVMNLLWIAALTLLVAAEKLLPGGRWIGRVAGAGLVAAGLWVLA